MTRWLWRIYLGVGVAVVAVGLAGVGGGLQQAVWPVLNLATLLAVALGPRINDVTDRRPWRLFLAGLVLFSVSGTATGTAIMSSSTLPFLAVRLGFTLGQLCTAAGVSALVRYHIPKGDPETRFDAAIVGLSLAALIWTPASRLGAAGLDGGFAVAAQVIFPVVQIVAAVAGVRLVFAVGPRVPSAWLLLAVSTLQLAGNIGLSLVSGDRQGRTVTEIAFMALSVCLGTAALHPSARVLSQPQEREQRVTGSFARLLVLGCALAGGSLGLLAEAGLLTRPSLPAAASLLVTALALYRMARLVADHEQGRRAQLMVADLGRRALEDVDVDGLLAEATAEVARTLGVEYAGVAAHRDGDDLLGLVAGTGWREGTVGSGTMAVRPGTSLAPLLRGEIDVQRRPAPPDTDAPFLTEHGVRDAAGAVIRGDSHGRSYGMLLAASSRRHEFRDRDLDVLRSVANLLAGAITRRRTEEEIRHRAFHDPLTGLANRDLFLERLTHVAERLRRSSELLAVLFIDLDDFKTVNDSLGHAAGDELLVRVAERIRGILRPGDTAARLGGDEFAVLLEQLEGESAAIAVAERLQSALADPVTVAGHPVRLSASIGITWTDDPGATADALLRDADTAMYTAKEGGKGTHELFRPAMHAQALQRLELKGDLDRAVREGELFLEYQPIVAIGDARVIGAEALVRWQHPVRGRVAPDCFIGLAEESGAIVPLGRWVLQEACRQAATWQGDDVAVSISVNVSGRQLAFGIVDDVASALSAAGLPADRLILELTESVLLSTDAGDVLAELRALGVRLAIDDFGTGYSSLGQLRNLRPDVLKIDRSFIAELADGGGRPSVAQGMLHLSNTLGIVAVAEGVEVPEQLAQLLALGCEFAQGYYFDRPLAPEDFLARLRPAGVA